MKSKFKTIWVAIMLLLFGTFAKAQTPPTITGSLTSTSAICSGTGSITINTATSAAPYNLVNADLSSLPVGATVGGVNHTPTFTSGNPHYVLLTPANNDKRGFITFAETTLKPVNFIATFGLYVGNGNGADGTSFNYGKVNTSTGNYGEAGMIDSGLAVGFNDFSNKIFIYYNKVQLTSFNVNGTLNNSGWKSVSIEVTGSGQLTLSHGGNVYCTNYQLPAAYVTDNKTNWKYGFAARTGGLNNLHAVNDVVIKDRTPWEYSVDGTNFTTNNNFTNLNPGTYNAYARIGNAAYNANGYNSTASIGTQTITALSFAATLTPTNPTTCTATGTIAISNVTHNMASYDLVNVSLTNNQLGNATIGNLGTCCNPFFGAGDLVLTPNTSNRAGYIAFNSTVATPNAFSANYDVFVGAGNGGDGLSFNYGNLNTAGTAGVAETGMVNSGLAVGFSDYSNTIKIYYNKTVLQSYNATVNAGGYKSVAITVTQDGKITIVHGGITICSNYQLPAAYATDNKSSWQYALAARCGASNNYHSVKNVVIKDNDIQYSANGGQTWTSATTLTGLATGNYTIIARQSNGSYCPNASQVGTATITYTPDITATVSSTSPTTCTTVAGGTITISNVSNGLSSPYDLVNISLTNQQLGASTIGNLGTCCNPIWGGFGDLVLTPNTSNRAGYIAFNSTVAQPNAFSANYDVFVGGGNGGDGISFNYGDLNTSGSLGGAESGIVNSGLAIGFNDYSNTIKIYYNKTELQSYNQNLNVNTYKSVALTVTQDGKLTLVYGGTTICSNYQLPAAYTTDNKSNWKYALAARCGASNNYHSVKNVVIKDNSIQYTINGTDYTENPNFTNVVPSTYNVRARISNGAHCSALGSLGSVTITPPPGMVAITGQPSTTNQSVAQNATATTLSVTATGAATISYQWYSNTTATNNGGNPIVGATSASYTPPTSAVGTKYYYCLLSNACSEVISAVSGSVTTYLPAPNISYTTPNTFIVGTLISPLIPTNTGGEIRSTTFSTFAGSGSIGSTDGTGTAASFKYPDNVIMDKSGNLFVADRSNHLIRKITPAGVVTTFAGNGTAASVDGTGTGASINFPSGLAFDTIGNLYVGERQGYKIRKITPNGVVTTLAGSGTKASVDGTGTAASFDFIEKITIDKSTNDLYVCEGNSRKIRKVTSLGVVTTFAGSGAYANSEGTGTAASFINPLGITIDANKNLYVTSGELIFKITPSAVVTRYAGTPGTYGSADGTTTSATFNYGSGITIDASGNFYVADLGGGKIRKISTSGIVSSISEIVGSAGIPRGLVLDASGNNLYVADYGHKIIKIALGGGGYTITPALPAGLSMDANTGIISGTPSMITAATDYTIIANNDAGSDSFNINIKVCTPTISSNSIAICPSALPYSWNGLTFNAAGTQTKTGFTNAAGCDSSATLTLTVNNIAAPTASAQTFCSGATVASLAATVTSSKWYTDSTGGSALATTTALTTGTYYVSQTVNSCESTRTSVAVTVNTTAAPTASAQTFNGSATVGNLVATGTSLNWYAAATGGTALATSTALATGTYYVTQTLNGCESARTSVAVTVNTVFAPTASAQSFCGVKTVADLVATGTDLKWYSVATGGTALATSTVLASGTYYVSQTLNNIESARTSVAVTVVPLNINKTTMVSCGSYTWAANGQTYTTSGEYLHQNVVSNTYCAATSSAEGCVTGDEYISNVTIGAINKTSLCGNSDNYNDYTSNSTAVLAGSSYAISVTNAHNFSRDSISVWADWNQDGDFTDSGEEYSLSYSSNFNGGSGPGYGTGSIAVPSGASNGNVRMRIRVVWNETPLACGNTEYGEIEDYTLVVSGGVSNSTCPTYEKLVLTIKAVTSSSNSIAICSSALPYSWNGLTFNAAGTQTKTGLTNAAGCDSSASLTITLKATSTSSNNVTINSNQLPFSWNGLTFNAAGTQTAHLTNAAGCDSAATLTLQVNAASATLNVTAFLQGLYLGGGIMTAAPFNVDGVSSPTVADTITVELRNPDYSLAYSVRDTLSTTGQASVTFPSSAVGNKYYVVIKHRNSVETWSSDSILIGSTTSYDFSSGSGQAYFDGGAKMPLVNDGSGLYLIYSGDITQDGAVDFNDYPNLDSENILGTYPSYLATDLNGDGTTDFNDYPLMDTNNILGLVLQRPY